MSNLTKVQQKLENCIINNELFDLDKIYSATEIAVKFLGYKNSPNGRILSEIKHYLINNDYDISHFIKGQRPNNSSIEKTCPVCNKPFKKKIFSTKKEQITCSIGCANTYFRSGINHPNYKSGISLYRKLALKLHKKCFFCAESELLEIHHIDKNRFNNKIDNLISLCPTHHKKVHLGLINLTIVMNAKGEQIVS